MSPQSLDPFKSAEFLPGNRSWYVVLIVVVISDSVWLHWMVVSNFCLDRAIPVFDTIEVHFEIFHACETWMQWSHLQFTDGVLMARQILYQVPSIRSICLHLHSNFVSWQHRFHISFLTVSRFTWPIFVCVCVHACAWMKSWFREKYTVEPCGQPSASVHSPVIPINPQKGTN